MDIQIRTEHTKRGTFMVVSKGFELEVNLIPGNACLAEYNPRPGPAAINKYQGGKNLYIGDCVGIVGLKLDGCQKTPRINWDNREHHFWEGFTGGFEPRNTIVNEVAVNEKDGGASVEISFYYIVNYIKTKITWRFSQPPKGVSVLWDTVIEAENMTGRMLNDYMSFFACYHHPGINYYYDASGEIRKCADVFYACADPENRTRYKAITAEWGVITKDWHGIKNPTEATPLYKKPILLSGPQPWYNGGRHIIMVEEEPCVAIVSAVNQARDYMLGPPAKVFAPGASFTARVRHMIAKADSAQDLENLWLDFAHGGYETTLGPPSHMAPETGNLLADAAIKLIKKNATAR